MGAICAILLLSTGTVAWDSASWKNPTRPTHTSMTEYAIKQLSGDYPELDKYRKQLIAGSNVEMHEFAIECTQYGVDFNTRRSDRYEGTNAGCNYPELIWEDAKDAYEQGKKELAYFTFGLLLHEIQDMGVPAHAHDIEHQANPTEFDNFEYMALWNWKPDFSLVDKEDPAVEDVDTYADPSAYYQFGKNWCLEDAPNYKTRNDFSKTWTLASEAERRLLSQRQAASCLVTKWALEKAAIAFQAGQE